MKILLSLLLSIMSIAFHAQNLVPNWSFEEYNTCPDHVDNISDCVGWMNFAGSCDYFNACADGGLSVPENGRGQQEALEGDAYLGLIARQLSLPLYREYPAVELIENLTIGQEYFFSMYTSRADLYGNAAIRRLGMSLSTTTYDVTHPLQPTNIDFVESSFFLTNSQLWTQISGSFTADSAYRYLIIGNFYTDEETEFMEIVDPGWAAYYYIDGVRLSSDSLYAIHPLQIPSLQKNNTAFIYPNPSEEQITIESGYEFTRVRIMTIPGEECMAVNTKNNTKNLLLDTSDLSTGFYMVEITYARHIEYHKILKL